MKQKTASTKCPDDDAGKALNFRQAVSPPPLPVESKPLSGQFTLASSLPPIPLVASDGDDVLKTGKEVSSARQKLVYVWSPRRHRRSTSWLCSIALHVAGLLLLLLILAPADFGGTGTTTLVVTLDQSVTLEELSVFEAAVADFLPSRAEVGSPPPNALLNQPLLNGIGSRSDGRTPGRSGSARGSFFGIDAGGHEFVYVLDMSGSMKGRRFDRASEELMRSVEQLGPHQNFYVLLFSSGTLQLFGGSEYLPKPVGATTENKERLEKWLTTSFKGGGTDPREALRIAMRMNPSAIFMLSDGEFNGQEQQKQEQLLGGNADAFSIVAAASYKTPIHSIAFEDRRSRENMKRLADMTEGEFRFVPLEDGMEPAEALQKARSAMQQGDTANAEKFLHKAITNFDGELSEDLSQIKVDTTELLLELAKNGLKEGDLQATRLALTEAVRMDEKAMLNGKAQNWLIDKLLEHLRNSTKQNDVEDTLSFWPAFLKQFPRSTAAMQVRDLLAQLHLNKARQLYEQGDSVYAIRNLDFVMTTLPQANAFQDCQAEHDRIGEEFIQAAQELRQEQGDVASAQYLRKLVVDFDGTLFQQNVTQTLEEQAREMLVAARDAGLMRNAMKQTAIHRELNKGFGDDPLLKRVRQELALDERRAQAMMRTAVRLEQSSRTAAAEKYRTLVQDYSGTLAARLAEERLRFVGW